MENLEPEQKLASGMSSKEIWAALDAKETISNDFSAVSGEVRMSAADMLNELREEAAKILPQNVSEALSRIQKGDFDEVCDFLEGEIKSRIAAIPPEEQQRIVERGIEASRRRRGMVG